MKIAFVGFGEAAGAFVSGWGAHPDRSISAYDIKIENPEAATEIRTRAEDLGVASCDRLKDALSGADVIFSAVTADQAVAAAEAGAPHIEPGAIWCDINSCSPGAIRAAAAFIEEAGGHYVDIAVMAPVYPKRNLVPCLAAGRHAASIALLLGDLPMSVRVVGDKPGQASAIKMIRSVMVKGLEALTAECALAAVAAGVEEEVLPSLKDGHPKLDVAKRAAYNFERSLQHGARRAAEMEEVAATLTELGLPNGMAKATAEWQRAIAASGAETPDEGEEADYRIFAERILRRLRKS